jgi:hypothetical protein
MTSVTLDEIVFDDSIYPRATWSKAAVERYADALQSGETLPPIVLEAGTKRLLDGRHRTEAHRLIGRHFIAVDFQEVPDGVPAKLYAASLSVRHGEVLADKDKLQVAREIAEANPDYSMVMIASYLAASRQTVSRYVGDIVEHRRELRRAQAALLGRAGWSHRQIGEHLGVDHKTVGSDVTSNISPQPEELLREAAAALPIDAEPLVVEMLRERNPEPAAEPGPQTPEPPAAPTALVGGSGSTPDNSGASSPAPEPDTPSRPRSSLAVSPEQRQQLVDDAARTQAIDNAHKKADRLVREVSGLITEIVMVAGLRAEADRLEQWMEKQA